MRSALILPILILCTPGAAMAATVNVATPTELIAAIGAAQKGDEIVLADGDYAIGQNLSCSVDGEASAPIVVRAASPGKAVILFDALEGFKVSGKHWRFSGLFIRGVCADDSNCEHAFHVTGDADDFVMSGCTVRDFNAQLKVNANKDGNGAWQTPDRGLIEGCDLGDDHPRKTSNPVTKLNIDTGDDWVVRGNFIHDFRKDGGNEISYGAFMKSGGKRGLYEHNLVACSYNDKSGGVRIGLSFGGGGTGAQFCAPAFDASVPCNIEHEDGVMKNNIITSCSDVGVYLNRAKNTRLLHNTLVGTSGVDFRFDTTSGEADGNLLEGKIRDRDGATHAEKNNVAEVASGDFAAWYTNPLAGDLSIKGDVSSLVGKIPQRPDVTDDYCARARPQGPTTVGALEHSLGSCPTMPPYGSSGGQAGAGGSGQAGSGQAGEAGSGQAGEAGSGQAGSGQAGQGTAGTGGSAAGAGGAAAGGAGAPAAGAGGAAAGAAGTAGGAAGSSGGAGKAGGSAGAAGKAGGSGGSAGAAASEDDGGGCGCRVGAPSPKTAWWALALAVGAAVRRRARGRRA